MNGILCPVSAEKVNEKILRFTAFLIFLIALVFIYQPFLLLVIFLAELKNNPLFLTPIFQRNGSVKNHYISS